MLNFARAWIAHKQLCKAEGRDEGLVLTFEAGFNAACAQMALGQTNVAQPIPGPLCQVCGRVGCGDECPSVEWRPEKTDWGGEWVEEPHSPYPVYHSSKSVYYHNV